MLYLQPLATRQGFLQSLLACEIGHPGPVGSADLAFARRGEGVSVHA